MAKYISQLRRGTAQEWADSGIVPLEGEMVAELDKENNRQTFKIGDGIHAYPQLAYLTAGGTIITQSLTRATSITLYPDNWEQDSDDRWYQTPEISGVVISNKDKVDLQPSPEQLCVFYEKGIAFVTKNNDGVVSVYCIGQVPQNEYTIQATVTEVEASGTIIGDTTATPNPRPDWNQTDDTKANYIDNKPDISDVIRYSTQELTETQKAQVRSNIDAGKSNFSGSYNDLTDIPASTSISVSNETLIIN